MKNTRLMDSPPAIRGKQLIDLLHKYDDTYHKYEYKEMLENIVSIIEQCVFNGEPVFIDKLGTFIPRYNESRKVLNVRTKQYEMSTPSVSLKFKPTAGVQGKLKKLSRDRIKATNQDQLVKETT